MEHYKITFSVGGNSIEISSHDKSWVEEKIKEYNEVLKVLRDNVIKISRPEESKNILKADNLSISSISINEFYKKYMSGKVTSRPEIATFFVYYLTKSSGKKEFASSEIKEQFKQVGYPSWNSINVTDTLSQAKKRAFLNNYNNLWSLSMTGEDFVLNKMADNG